MKTAKSLLALLTLLTVAPLAYGQDAEMADTFRSEGKIYVVVAIILIVLAGLIAYLFIMDRKLGKLEHLLREKMQTKPGDKTFTGLH